MPHQVKATRKPTSPFDQGRGLAVSVIRAERAATGATFTTKEVCDRLIAKIIAMKERRS